MATKEEVEELKVHWLQDPCWDIENTEGFEDFSEELRAFRKKIEAEADKRIREQTQKRIDRVVAETGVKDQLLAQHLLTFAEILLDVKRNAIGEASPFEMSMVELSQAQTRATLLLAAQVKRVADVLESIDGRDSLNESVRIWGS